MFILAIAMILLIIIFFKGLVTLDFSNPYWKMGATLVLMLVLLVIYIVGLSMSYTTV